MNQESFTVSSPKDPAIAIKVTPGHFATSSSHVSHYLDMTSLKTRASVAKEVARELAVAYLSSRDVNTIVCMENTEIIGAYLAEELLQEGIMVMNSGGDIHVMTPINATGGQLIFQKNERKRIQDQRVLLLVASVSSGNSASRALDCISYYGGELVGISALFSAIRTIRDQEINAIFTDEDIPGYHFDRPERCTLCKEGQRLEGIVNSAGYTLL